MSAADQANRRFRQNPKDPSFYNDPYKFYGRLHEISGPIFWEDYGFWCLTEFDAVNQALRDSRFRRLPPPDMAKPEHPSHLSAFAKVERYSLLALEPPNHTRIRKSVNQAFVNRRVQEMADDIETLANQLIDDFTSNNIVDLLTHYATPIPVTVIARLLGVPDEHRQNLLDWSHAMVKVYTLTQSKADEIAANSAAEEFDALLLSLIAERRKKPQHDLLSHLVTLEKDPLSDEEIVSTAVLLLNAGHEATVHQIGNAVKAILTETTSREWIDNETAGDQLITEAMRYDAPLHLFTRFAQEAIEIHPGTIIEKGEEIALLLGAANVDPKRFEHPRLFNPLRKDTATVAFGGGLHFCIGTVLAKLEMRIAINTLFKRLPNLELANVPHYQNSFHFHGLESLQVKCNT